MKKENVKNLLNLESYIDIEKICNEGGVTTVYIKSKKKKVRCPRCNTFSHKIHDYLKPSKIKYLTNSGNITYLVVRKRRFECSKCKKAFTEDLNLTSNKGNVSLLTKRKVLKDFLDKDKTIADVAKENNISEEEARKIFDDAMESYPKILSSLPEIISFDENSTKTGAGLYSFIINDPIRHVTLDILPSREKSYLINYFTKIERARRLNVKVVICDLYLPYLEVSKICFPNAIFVADPFHYTRYVLDGLDKVRIRYIHYYESINDKFKYRMLKSRLNKGLLLKSFSETKGEQKIKNERLKRYEKGQIKDKPKDKFKDYWYGTIKIKQNNKYIEKTRMDRLTEVLKVSNEVALAYSLKEEFLRITINCTYDTVEEELITWMNRCYEAKIPEMIDAANTIKNWLPYIVNSFKDVRFSNGFTEANNNVIDKIISTAYGYKNFDFFRKRTLAILHQSYSETYVKKSENNRLKK